MTAKHFYEIIEGQDYRAKLEVYDYSDAPVIAWRDAQVYFSVAVLPQSAHRFTCYAGHLVYYGHDLAEAFLELSRYVGEFPLPPRLFRYTQEPPPNQAA